MLINHSEDKILHNLNTVISETHSSTVWQSDFSNTSFTFWDRNRWEETGCYEHHQASRLNTVINAHYITWLHRNYRKQRLRSDFKATVISVDCNINVRHFHYWCVEWAECDQLIAMNLHYFKDSLCWNLRDYDKSCLPKKTDKDGFMDSLDTVTWGRKNTENAYRTKREKQIFFFKFDDETYVIWK